jgi:glycosyltransferase involved in cell wall biosynthesis
VTVGGAQSPGASEAPRAALRVLVVTIVHNPQDARILHREIAAITAAGHEVTYAAPFEAYGSPHPPGLRSLDLPRALGRRRVGAVRAARRLLHREAPAHDIVLLHDPELLIASAGIHEPPTVWDVHEDTAASVTLKPWLPGPLRRPTASAFRRLERAMERGHHLLLAEEGYAVRFRDQHPVVPNSTVVPAVVQPPGRDRVVYIGALSRARGALEMVQVGRLLAGSGVTLHLVGGADSEVRDALSVADASGDVVWHGFLPNDRAMALLSGALAGLSLLSDEPNYRHSRPTKIIEYLAWGVPVITTPTPPAVELVEAADAGVVVPFHDPSAVASAVLELAADPPRAQGMARRGHEAALRDHDWTRDGPAFVRQLEQWARG